MERSKSVTRYPDVSPLHYPAVSPATYTTSRPHTAPAMTEVITIAEAAQPAATATGSGSSSSLE